MFKEMKIKFKVVKDLKNLNRNLTFYVSRYKSGAFAYGDRSGHSISISSTDGTYYSPEYYDTRYDGISTKKGEWIEFWKDFIESNWQVKLEDFDYQESEV